MDEGRHGRPGTGRARGWRGAPRERVPAWLATVSVALVAAAAFPAAVRAQDARALFEEGARLYEDGEYAQAARRWEAAYAEDPRPGFQYNLAQAYERLGEGTRALAAYERYLATEAAGAPNRARAERRRAALRRRVAAAEAEARVTREPAAVDRAAATMAPAMEPGPAIVGPVLVAVAALAAVAAVVTGALALEAASASPDAPDDAYALATATDVLAPAAGALAVGGGLMWWWHPESPDRASAGVALRGRFE